MYRVDLANVLKSEYPAVIRMAAIKLQENAYLDVGSFLKGLNKADLKELNMICSRIALKQDNEPDFDCIVLLSDMLAQAEGVDLVEHSMERVATLMILISFEELFRNDLIVFKRELATLNGDLPSGIADLKM